MGTTGPQEPVAAPKPPLPIAAAPSPSRTEIDDPALQTRLVRVADQALDAAGGEGPEPSLGFRPLSGPVPVVSQELVSQEPPVPAARPMKRLSLEAVMRFIMNQAADLQAGQLDVYRVFIRVNTKLLRRNGITTLRFEDDHLVSDPELQDAITLSLERTLGLRCPEACFL
ncbi:MAG: hypothetical protein MI919_09135 [Holophagales bacterium]|nr:hypothetical protein [Holophagales bacterium]